MNKIVKKLTTYAVVGGMVLSQPLGVFASGLQTGTNTGAADGSGAMPGATDQTLFRVAMPTNETINSISYWADPNKVFSSSIQGVITDNFDSSSAVRLYFQRADYEGSKVGNDKRDSSTVWGRIENLVSYTKEVANMREGNKAVNFGDDVYSGLSNWMTITNRSNVPISVKLKATATGASGVTLVQNETDIKATGNPAMYFELQTAEGTTDKLTEADETYVNKDVREATNPISDILVKNGVYYTKPILADAITEMSWVMKTEAESYSKWPELKVNDWAVKDSDGKVTGYAKEFQTYYIDKKSPDRDSQNRVWFDAHAPYQLVYMHDGNKLVELDIHDDYSPAKKCQEVK